MKLAKKAVVLLMLFTLGGAAVYIVNSLIHYSGAMTSFPWWTCLVFAGIYFCPVVAFEAVLYGILVLVDKLKAKKKME